jgi:hypothetical protein
MKKSVTTLFKHLVLVERVSMNYVIETLRNNHEWDLDYLKDYLLCLKEKISKKDIKRGELHIRTPRPKKCLSM